MTISSQIRKAGPYAGNDAATAFPFAFKVFSASDVYVVRADSAGLETPLTLTTDYTVSLNADQNANPGGTVTLPAALASTYTLTITSSLEYLQPTDLTNQGGFYPKVVTDAFDRLTIFCQQLSERIGRAALVPLSSTLASRALKGMGFDASGNPTLYALQAGSSLIDLAASAGASLIGFIHAGIGAIKRTVQDKMRETVSVLDFGAVGDGVTDDTAAIQKAIDAVAVGGGTVLFPAGRTYIVAGSLSVLQKSSVCLVGQGNATAGAAFGSILKFTASSGTRLIDARGSYGFSLKGLYVWQSNAAYSGAVVDLTHGPSNLDSAYSIIRENIFVVSGAVKIIDVTKAIISTIAQNHFNGGTRAVNCDTGATNYANVINIIGNTHHNQTSAPIYNGGSASINWNVSGNTFEPLSTGAAGALWTKGIAGLTFTGNYCGDANATGYWVVFDGGVSGASVSGNLFAMGAFGVYMQGSPSNQAFSITANVFSSVGTSDVYIDGASTAYGDVCNNLHYLSTARITGTLSGGRYQTDATGNNIFKGSVQFDSLSPNGVGATQSGVLWKVTSSGSSNIPSVLKAHASQSVSIHEWRDSSENVLGKIRSGGGIDVTAPEPNFYAGRFENKSATSPYGIGIFLTGVTGGAGMPFITAGDAGANRFQVSGNGNVQNTNNSYGAISDPDLKTGITKANSQLDDVELLSKNAVNYNLLSDP